MNIAVKRRTRLRNRARAVGLYWAASATFAFVAAYPFARTVGGTGVRSFPAGDAALFAPGGTLLIELLRVGGGQLAAVFEASVTLAVLGSFAMLLPLSAMLVALHRGSSEPLAVWLGRAVRHLPAFALLAGITVLAEAVTLFIVLSAAFGVHDFAANVGTERSGDLAFVACAAFGLLLLFLLEIVEDLARAAVVAKRRNPLPALGESFGVLFSAPLRVLAAWAVPAVGFAALVVLGAVLVDLLHVERPGAWRVALAFLVHQGVILGRATLRAVWLSRALHFARN